MHLCAVPATSPLLFTAHGIVMSKPGICSTTYCDGSPISVWVAAETDTVPRIERAASDNVTAPTSSASRDFIWHLQSIATPLIDDPACGTSPHGIHPYSAGTPR